MTLLAAIFLAQIVLQPVPPAPSYLIPVPAQPAPPPVDESVFQPDVWNGGVELNQDFSVARASGNDARTARVQELSRQQRVQLYDSTLEKLGRVDAAIAEGAGRQEDEIGEARATIAAIKNTNPESSAENSNLEIGAVAAANAEVAERQSNDANARAELARAQRALIAAREAAQSSAR